MHSAISAPTKKHIIRYVLHSSTTITAMTTDTKAQSPTGHRGVALRVGGDKLRIRGGHLFYKRVRRHKIKQELSHKKIEPEPPAKHYCAAK